MIKGTLKKSDAGRKKLADKKMTINLFVRQSVIKEKGGMETVKKMCYDLLGVEG